MKTSEPSIDEITSLFTEHSAEINNWLDYFHSLDARSSLIIAAERISFHLGKLITEDFITSGNTNFIIPEELAHRAKHALKLNLIEEPVFQIITQVRKLRNIVAHTFHNITYEDETFDDIFRIIILNIKKVGMWDLQLLIDRYYFYQAADNPKFNYSFDELESIFTEFIYDNRKAFLTKVLINVIISVDGPSIKKIISHIDSTILIKSNQNEYDAIKNDVMGMIEKLNENSKSDK